MAAAPPLHVCTHSCSPEHTNTHTFFVRSDELSFCAQTYLGLEFSSAHRNHLWRDHGSKIARENKGRGYLAKMAVSGADSGHFDRVSDFSSQVFRERLVMPSGCGGTVGSISLPVKEYFG